MTGRVVEIERFAVHDGPGIRTTVFLKGCPLRCVWCHNPETMKGQAEVSFDKAKCIACGECVAVCPHDACAIEDNARVLDRARCRVCGTCIEHCSARAVELVGREWNVDEVMREVLRDRAFFARSGGGLTISGGEPLMQAEFTAALLAAAKDAGLHCAIETSGFVPWQSFERVRERVDLFLFDCKETGAGRHRELTGQSNELILDNLRKLHALGAAITLQCPIVPGCNDTLEHIDGIARLAHSLPRLKSVRILPYHPLGTSKLARFGIGHTFTAKPPSSEQVNQWRERLRNQGVVVEDGA